MAGGGKRRRNCNSPQCLSNAIDLSVQHGTRIKKIIQNFLNMQMGRKKISITRLTDERNRQVKGKEMKKKKTR